MELCGTLPACGNCAKNSTECAYDPEIQQDVTQPNQTRVNRTKRQRDTRSSKENTDQRPPTYGPSKQASLSNGRKTDLLAVEAHLAQLVSLVQRLRKDNEAHESTDMPAAALNPSVETAPIEDGGFPSKLTAIRPDFPFNAAADCSSDEFPIPNGQTTDLVDPLETSNLGHMSLGDGGRSRYVGTTYWAYISHEMEELNQLLGNQSQSHKLAAAGATAADSAHSKQRQRKASINSQITSQTTFSEPIQKAVGIPSGCLSPNDNAVELYMLEHIPTKWQSDILYKGFVTGVHSLSPIIHPPMIFKLYIAFWDWYDCKRHTGEPCPSLSFIPLLYAIWFGGSVSISMRTMETEFNTSSRAVLSTKYSEEVTSWLAKISFPHSVTLHGLAAYLITQTILSREEEPLASSLFVSLAVRVAQTLGLHRDPAHFNIDPWEAEFRRRLWWHIMHMDAVIAMSSGLPPLLTDTTYWDVRETSEVKDTLLGTTEAKRYEQSVAHGERIPDNPDSPTLCGGSSMVSVALRHCYAFMEKFIRLATDPDFQPFQWGWPGNHQPMHAMIPESSVSRGFVDRILSLSGPDGGVVSGGDDIFTQRPLRHGGREAWGMIRRLRQKAWQKAGLSPQLPRTGQAWPTEFDFANAPNFKSKSSATVDAPAPSAAVTAALSCDKAFAPDLIFARSSAATIPTHQSPVTSSTVNFLDPADQSLLPDAESAPFPIDPSLNFDWDEWDYIFGQSLPVADELMELDQTTGLAFADLENGAT
ncbi:C6 transcription factor, putative [Penicillium digitatum PHI26]|uniref:C6 transcription factor, putative n=2 Tax=Penicillium digitatum TaxID=36651 RepID=K9FDJ9_PEND2|nr:C6 transcription factor, putative [Penicillium digitatum Pd1]EKV06257.1 C6 transcription factor, putative [Penicillium digitatum PHI26]EKV18393.1 C6 transcription factor, putative [Penicillium digitatum Pd1]